MIREILEHILVDYDGVGLDFSQNARNGQFYVTKKGKRQKYSLEVATYQGKNVQLYYKEGGKAVPLNKAEVEAFKKFFKQQTGDDFEI